MCTHWPKSGGGPGMKSARTPLLRVAQRLAAVGRLERAHGGCGDPHPVVVGWVSDDRVEAQPAVARLPVGPRRVLAQPGHVAPGLAAVVAPEQPGRLDAGVERPVRRVQLPDGGDLGLVVAVGQAGARLRPRLAVVGAAPDRRPVPVVAAAGVERPVRGANEVVRGPVSQNGPRNRQSRRASSLSRMKAPFLVPTRTSTRLLTARRGCRCRPGCPSCPCRWSRYWPCSPCRHPVVESRQSVPRLPRKSLSWMLLPLPLTSMPMVVAGRVVVVPLVVVTQGPVAVVAAVDPVVVDNRAVTEDPGDDASNRPLDHVVANGRGLAAVKAGHS